MRHHQPDARRDIGFLEVGRDAFLELIRLANVQHLALDIEKTINPRQQWQAVDEFPGVELSLRVTHIRSFSPAANSVAPPLAG